MRPGRAKELDLPEAIRSLHRNFQKAKKPLNLIVEQCLQYKGDKFFG